MIETALRNATSGLQANSLKLANSASNIANAQSTSTTAGQGAYTPLDTQNISQPGGGVRAVTTQREPATVQAQLPGNLLANDQGFIEFPNVNLEEELVAQLQAAQAYKANSAVIAKVQDLGETLIDALE